jgi:purine-cytosine permease-like protein
MDNLLNDSGRTSTSPKREGSMTKSIEHQTAKNPSTYFLAAAGTAVAISLGLAVMNKRKGWANFVGSWVPSILMLGIYNKIVKTHGSDAQEARNLH